MEPAARTPERKAQAGSLRYVRLLVVAGVWFAPLAPARAQSLSDLPRANTVVKPQAYVSLQPVPRGRSFEVAVVARILPGFHINANRVLEDYLIPTVLNAELPAGFQMVETIYPEGELQKFEFAEKLMNVYEDTVTLRMKLRALPGAPLGAASLPLVLRYQACNDRACLPPVNLPVAAELHVAAAGAKAQPAHPEVFRRSPPGKNRK